LQQAAPEDKSELAQDVADAAREKHEIVLEQLKARLSEKAKDSVDRATLEERKDTTQNAKDKDKQEKKGNRGNDGSPQNNTSPRGSERTTAPRTTPPARRP